MEQRAQRTNVKEQFEAVSGNLMSFEGISGNVSQSESSRRWSVCLLATMPAYLFNSYICFLLFYYIFFFTVLRRRSSGPSEPADPSSASTYTPVSSVYLQRQPQYVQSFVSHMESKYRFLVFFKFFLVSLYSCFYSCNISI